MSAFDAAAKAAAPWRARTVGYNRACVPRCKGTLRGEAPGFVVAVDFSGFLEVFEGAFTREFFGELAV
jgi:hypothetical protein